MDKSIEDIIKKFDEQGDLLVAGKRNIIKTFPYRDIVLNIKSFKVPILFNGIIYRFFRKSKARRSFEYASYLLQKKIGTPKPIGYLENKTWLRLLDSYYVCEHIQVDYVFKDLFDGYHEDLDVILNQLGRFCFQLHEAGIEFKDHSPGNTLIKKDEGGAFTFYLIDLNRMAFHKEMSFEMRMKNLCRLTPSEYMIRKISAGYAELYPKSEQEIFNLMWQYTQSFFSKSQKRQDFKKKFKLK